jgi:hypothetical protein
MQRLDDVCGMLWQRSHSRDNKNCTVSIFNKELNQWIGREDTGSESMAEAQKGLASDSFKRACSNWGIGRELYDYPAISVKLNKDEWEMFNNKPKQTWNLKLKQWVWFSQFENGKISYLAAKFNNKLRFQSGEFKKTKAV